MDMAETVVLLQRLRNALRLLPDGDAGYLIVRIPEQARSRPEHASWTWYRTRTGRYGIGSDADHGSNPFIEDMDFADEQELAAYVRAQAIVALWLRLAPVPFDAGRVPMRTPGDPVVARARDAETSPTELADLSTHPSEAVRLWAVGNPHMPAAVIEERLGTDDLLERWFIAAAHPLPVSVREAWVRDDPVITELLRYADLERGA